MKFFAILLAMTALALPSSPPADSMDTAHNFTVNLLTQVENMSVQSDPIGQSAPISFENATIQHVYDNVTYSVVGSVLFESESIGTPQRYQVETLAWGKAVEITLNAPTEAKHVDIALSKLRENGEEVPVGIRFDWLSKDLPELDLSNVVTVSEPYRHSSLKGRMIVNMFIVMSYFAKSVPSEMKCPA